MDKDEFVRRNVFGEIGRAMLSGRLSSNDPQFHEKLGREYHKWKSFFGDMFDKSADYYNRLSPEMVKKELAQDRKQEGEQD